MLAGMAVCASEDDHCVEFQQLRLEKGALQKTPCGLRPRYSLLDVPAILRNFAPALQAKDSIHNEYRFVRKLGHPLLIEGLATRKVVSSR
jgi:hypothetical protein